MGDIPKNVFLSHVHEDDAEVANFRDLLDRHGYEVRDSSVTTDKPNDAKSPEYIKSAILAPRIQWASCVIVLISPDTHTSDWVDWEIEYAQKQDKRIVGVFVRGGQDSDVPEGLEKYADAVVGWSGPAIIDALSGSLDGWYTASGQARSPRSLPTHPCS